MGIVDKLSQLISRDKPNIYVKTEYKQGEMITNTTNTPKIKKYDYYICDFCGQEIRIKEKWETSEGGVCEIPSTITKGRKITLALHNKCINEVIKEFSENK